MQVETIEHTRDKGLAVSVYIGKRRGHASTSDFSAAALRQAVDAAYSIARFTAEDSAAGLPDADTLEQHPKDLDLYHPWDLDTTRAIDLVRRGLYRHSRIEEPGRTIDLLDNDTFTLLKLEISGSR